MAYRHISILIKKDTLSLDSYPDDKGEHQLSSHVTKLKRDLRNAYKMAVEASDKMYLCNKKADDKRTRVHDLEPDERFVSEKSWTER